jgi:hypothetical protein
VAKLKSAVKAAEAIVDDEKNKNRELGAEILTLVNQVRICDVVIPIALLTHLSTYHRYLPSTLQNLSSTYAHTLTHIEN